MMVETTTQVNLTLVECCGTSHMDTDIPEPKQLITRVWGDDEKEDYTDQHFRKQEL